MWSKIVCWLIGHIPDLIHVIGDVVICERCGQQCGTMDPKKDTTPVVTITAPPSPPKK